MKKKGFTLIELLVVIAIIAMLLAILMPALNKVKRLAQRLVCGTSCKGLGTAMMVYAQDFEDEYPMQGGSGQVTWSWNGRTPGWGNPDLYWADAERATVGASLYLLVRNADVDTRSFVCRSGDEKEFKGLDPNPFNIDLVELWDFGGNANPLWGGTADWPKEHVSYAYQLPYNADFNRADVQARPASATASASTAILADKNPWQDPKLSNGIAMTDVDRRKDFLMLVDLLRVDWDDEDDSLRNSTTAWQVQIANSQPHGREGQNVLFGDGHTSFEKRSDISYQNDNIYTMFAQGTGTPPSYSQYDKRTGMNRTASTPDPLPVSGSGHSFPRTDEDSLLVNDDSRYPAVHNWP
ncbi:MAG: type II secretion system protein [Planctomycetota bacterium]